MSLIHDTVSERAKHQENTHLTQVIAGWKPYILHHSIVGTAHSHDYNMIWLYIYIYTFCIIYRYKISCNHGPRKTSSMSMRVLHDASIFLFSSHSIYHPRSPWPMGPITSEMGSSSKWTCCTSDLGIGSGTGPPNAIPPKESFGIMVVHGG